MTVGCIYQTVRQPIPVEKVLAMTEEGIKAEEIITRIRESRTTYNLKAKEVWELIERGIDERVVDEMLETRVRDIVHYYQHTYCYYPYAWYGPYYYGHFGHRYAGFYCW